MNVPAGVVNDQPANVNDKSKGCEGEPVEITTTTTKNALLTTQIRACESAAHRNKISIIKAGKVGVACAIAILMKRISSEICLIDKDGECASAEAEDISRVGVFLGNPTITCGTDISKVIDSRIVILAAGESSTSGAEASLSHKIHVLRKLVPGIAKFASKAIIIVAMEPNDALTYATWKLSKFPTNRVIGTGTAVNSARFQYYLSQRLGLAPTAVSCMCIGSEGNESVPVWSNVNVAGLRLNEVNPRIGKEDDVEKWYQVSDDARESATKLNKQKGERTPICWGLGICTAEIVDAILTNTKVILPVSTYIRSCSHGNIDKDVFMSVPCVLCKDGVYHTMRQKLSEQEKSSLQACADGIRNVLRESGILQEAAEEDE